MIMSKSNKTKKEIIVLDNTTGMDYLKDIETDLNYSLSADPFNKYDLSSEHKKFIELYSQYNNLAVVAELLNINMQVAKDYLMRYSTRNELRRLNLARHHRNVATNIISFEDLGAYMSAYLIGDGIPEDEKLKKGDKLQLLRLLMEWHKHQTELSTNTQTFSTTVIEEELEELKATDIKELIQKRKLLQSIQEAEKEVKGQKPPTKKKSQNPVKINKDVLVSQIFQQGQFSDVEKEMIKKLTIEELKELIKT